MSVFWGILVGLLVLMVLVVVHEFGHFIMARRNGVEVEEFGIGLPPRGIAWQKIEGKWRKVAKKDWDTDLSKNGLIISINILPIGGFCKMKDENSAATTKGSFGQASFKEKTKILFGGVVANWLLSMSILTILAWTGMPHFLANQFKIESDTIVLPGRVKISEVLEDSPAGKAGLVSGDELKSLASNGEESLIIESDSLFNFNEAHTGEEVDVEYLREGELRQTQMTLNKQGAEYLMGASIYQETAPLYRATWSAPIVGIGTTLQLTAETFKGLGEMLWNLLSGVAMQVNFNTDIRAEGASQIEKAGEAVSGPVGIVGVIFPAIARSGLTNTLFLAALISVSLACMNVLPVPALDGGRWLLIAIYKLRKKKLSLEVEEKIVGRTFMILLGLIILITVLDIVRILG